MSHTGPILEGKGATDYERYVRVPELLELQKPIELLAHPEERLFQVTHQTAELWLHHIHYEIERGLPEAQGKPTYQTSTVMARRRSGPGSSFWL